MNLYRIQITGDKYPTEYNVEASGFPTAIARATREWKKRFKGSRATSLKILATKSSAVIKAKEE